MNASTKRSRNDSCIDAKKARPSVESVSDDWPVYGHPQGGTVKITPWGCLRLYLDPILGQEVTKFEESTFSTIDFGTPVSPEASPQQSQSEYTPRDVDMSEMPPTPQSIHYRRAIVPSPFEFSPSSEAEGYLREGYMSHSSPAQEYSHEQEHYLGMDDEELLS